jgi:hypothetical protein
MLDSSSLLSLPLLLSRLYCNLKPIAKKALQESQERRKRVEQEKKLKKQAKKTGASQLVDSVKLLFRSS